MTQPTSSNSPRLLPFIFGFLLTASLPATLLVLPLLMHLVLVLQPITPGPPVTIVRLIPYVVKPPKQATAKGAQTATKAPEHKSAGAPATAPAPGQNDVLAIPGSAEWAKQVHRGRRSALVIVVERSLPVLIAYGVPIAVDARLPRGTSNVFSLVDGRAGSPEVPDNAVIRVLKDMPKVKGFDAYRNKIEYELGGEMTIYAIYPEELYSALCGLAEESLKSAKVPVERIHTVHLELHLVGGRNFNVRLLDFS